MDTVWPSFGLGGSSANALQLPGSHKARSPSDPMGGNPRGPGTGEPAGDALRATLIRPPGGGPAADLRGGPGADGRWPGAPSFLRQRDLGAAAPSLPPRPSRPALTARGQGPAITARPPGPRTSPSAPLPIRQRDLDPVASARRSGRSVRKGYASATSYHSPAGLSRLQIAMAGAARRPAGPDRPPACPGAIMGAGDRSGR